MHILHLTPYMGLGGTERHILNLISQSMARGYEISLACPPGEGLKGVPPKVRIHALENWSMRKCLASAAALKKIALRIGGEVDLIQVHAAAEMAYLTKKYLPDKPVIFTCHGYNTHPPILNYWLASRFLKKIDCLIALTLEEKQYFLRGDIPGKRVVVIPNGVESRFFDTPHSRMKNGRVVGLVGRLVKEKNFAWAIKAQARYRFASRLLIVGDGPLRNRLERQVRGLGLEKEVTFLNYQEEMERIYPLFSYLLIPSRKEAFALVILESLAAGVPVLVPQWLSGVKDFYGSAPGVVVFKGGRDLKEKVEKDEGKKERGEIQRFAHDFLWENVFPQYEELYSRILARSSVLWV